MGPPRDTSEMRDELESTLAPNRTTGLGKFSPQVDHHNPEKTPLCEDDYFI